MPTVLIVDDHEAFRLSARRLLETEGFSVVGEAPDGMTALRCAREMAPDVVVLDVMLPDIDGFDVAKRLCADGDPPAIILTSSRDPSDFAPLIAASGARGFVPKSDLTGEALRALIPSVR